MANPTLRLGSSGDAVKQWQGIIKVKADGSFGPNTVAATKQWQTDHKLVPDGVVGPASWSMALGTKVAIVQKTAQAPTDIKAYEISKRADPNLPENQRQYVLSVARGEGFYGLGWANPTAATIAKSKEFGLTGYEGKDSNNWGADQGSGSAGSFPHVDYHADGTAYVGQYKRQKTPEEGFNAMKKIILGGGKRGAVGAAAIKTAIEKGSLRDAVFAQHDNGYFELAPEKYLHAMLNNYQILTANTEWKRLLSEKGGSLIKWGVASAVAGVTFLAGAFAFLKLRG
jgi:hypothetical protein